MDSFSTMCAITVLMAMGVMLAHAQDPVDPYQTFNVDHAKRLWGYAAATYCDNPSFVKAWAAAGAYPKAVLRGAPSSAPFTAVSFSNRQPAQFRDPGETSEFGLIAADPADNSIIVAFRGSANPKLWVQHYRYQPMLARLCPNVPGPCKEVTAHRGAVIAWRNVRAQVVSQVKQLLATRPKAVIHVTGHGLGGAIAHFAAIDLSYEFSSATVQTLYTYGEPRLGDARIGLFQRTRRIDYFRVINKLDPVPHFEDPRAVHTGLEVWYNNGLLATPGSAFTPKPMVCTLWKKYATTSCSEGAFAHACDAFPSPQQCYFSLLKDNDPTAFSFFGGKTDCSKYHAVSAGQDDVEEQDNSTLTLDPEETTMSLSLEEVPDDIESSGSSGGVVAACVLLPLLALSAGGAWWYYRRVQKSSSGSASARAPAPSKLNTSDAVPDQLTICVTPAHAQHTAGKMEARPASPSAKR